MPEDPPEAAIARLRLDTHRQGDVTVIECAGKLTVENAEALKNLGKTLIPQSRRIVLDFKEVTRIDSGGLGTVVGLYISAQRANCDVLLVNYNESIEDLLKITQLLSILSGEVG